MAHKFGSGRYRFADSLLALLALGVACGTSDAPGAGSAAGGAGATGSAGAGTHPGAGAGGMQLSGAGASAMAGGAQAGSATTNGGTGGVSTGNGGAGGTDTGGASASAGASAGSGGSAGKSAATPSAGCAKQGAVASGEIADGNDLYEFPPSYDGHTPMPMLLGLHAANNPMSQLRDYTNGSKLASDFVRVFPKSAGSQWVDGTDNAHIDSVFNHVLATYCVDTSRVFATGHSSGAQMVVHLLCASGGETRFRAVAPVAASKYCNKVSPIPAMYIQGMMDAQRGNGNGIDVVNFFTLSNGCSNATTPDTAVGTCKSILDQMNVTPGCVTYQGCSEPTIWCSHNDNNYNLSDGHMHGWPCFATNAMADFFLSF